MSCHIAAAVKCQSGLHTAMHLVLSDTVNERRGHVYIRTGILSTDLTDLQGDVVSKKGENKIDECIR